MSVRIEKTKAGIIIMPGVFFTPPEPPTPTGSTWVTGTDAEIAQIVAALNAGTITVAETGWQVGDTRRVHLSEVPAVSFWKAQPAQDVDLVLMHSGAPSGIRRTDNKDIHFMLGIKDVLTQKMDTFHYQSAWYGHWGSNSTLYAWFASFFLSAFPPDLQSIFSEMSVTVGAFNQTTQGGSNETVTCTFTINGYGEVNGATIPSNEASATEQWDWYKTAANRIKSTKYWTRSMNTTQPKTGYCIDINGDITTESVDVEFGISPVACI